MPPVAQACARDPNCKVCRDPTSIFVTVQEIRTHYDQHHEPRTNRLTVRVERYEFEHELPPELVEHWSDATTKSLLRWLSGLTGDLSTEELRARLEWWCRGENRALRKAMEQVHRTRCERGRGNLINRVTSEQIRARCKSWRECEYCAWVYGRAVERLFGQVKRLCAFVVFTMPAELGDWRNKAHISAQAIAVRRLRERLFRRYARRFAMVWTREHNTHGEGPGRLHLNLLWDKDWVDQRWLSKTAEECGFGRIVYISRVTQEGRLASGEGKGRRVDGYATKCLRYTSKELSSQSDWPKGTRRWGASRAARTQMRRPERNPDWYFSLDEEPKGFLPCDFGRYRSLTPDETRARGIPCVCANWIACCCGAWKDAGMPRGRGKPVNHALQELLDRASADRAPPAN